MLHLANGQSFASPRLLRRLVLLSAASATPGVSFAPSPDLRPRSETSRSRNEVRRRTFHGASPPFDDGVRRGKSDNANDTMSGGAEECSRNYDLAQDPSELFGIYPSPPSASHHNAVITSDWGESYFPYPLPTGEVKERNRVHRDGDWHRSIHAWVVQRDARGDGDDVSVLLQRRSPYKDTHPSLLDVSCAGHVNAGDDVYDTTMRELKEELGGNGAMHGISLEEIRRGRAFTITSANEGETKKFGRFICREFQDVFIFWLEGDAPIATDMFAPLVPEEVTGFEVLNGRELIARMRGSDKDLVPRSTEYIDAFEKALFGFNAIVK